MHRISTVAAVLLAVAFLPSPALAQGGKILVVAGPAAALESPRGDSRILSEVAAGTFVEVIEKWEDWYLVRPAETQAETAPWQTGWIEAASLQTPNGRTAAGRGGRLMVRGFGHAGGLLFNARNSFEAILGSTVNSTYGGGGQIVFPNGVFAQASVDMFSRTGRRALVSGDQVFTLDVPNRLTVRPVQVTVGYRVESANKIATYFGGGAGWHTLEEDSPSVPGAQTVSTRHVGYHIVGGAEYPLLRWMWIAGEVQWATVPKALGETGVSAVYGEKDLGGTSFRAKFIVGY
jgi:hypothetical protein